MERKINLNAVMFENGEPILNVIKSETGYLLFQESSEEYTIDFSILDLNRNLVDGGLLNYVNYNPISEAYFKPDDIHCITYQEFFEEINTYSPTIQFDENSITILDEEEVEEIWSYV